MNSRWVMYGTTQVNYKIKQNLSGGNTSIPVRILLLSNDGMAFQCLRLVLTERTDFSFLIPENAIFECSKKDFDINTVTNCIHINWYNNKLLEFKVPDLRKIYKMECIPPQINTNYNERCKYAFITSFFPPNGSQDDYELRSLDVPVTIAFDLPISFYEDYTIQTISFTLRSSLRLVTSKTDTETVTVDWAAQNNIHNAHFKTFYSQLDEDSTLAITFDFVSNSKLTTTGKVLVRLFENGELICGKIPYTVPTIEVSHWNKICKVHLQNVPASTFDAKQNKIIPCENLPIICFSINTIKGLKRHENYIEIMQEKVDGILSAAKSFSIRSLIPNEFSLILFEQRMFFMTKYFRTMAFWVFKAILENDLRTNENYTSQMIQFVEEKKLVESFTDWKFVDAVPYFATQTNCKRLREKIGYKILFSLNIEELSQFPPFLIEILKHEEYTNSTCPVLDFIINELFKKNRETSEAQQLYEALLWESASGLQKCDEYFDVYVNVFNTLAGTPLANAMSVKKEISDIQNVIMLISRIEEKRNNENPSGFFQYVTGNMLGFFSPQVDPFIEQMKKIKNFSFPFLSERVAEMKKQRIYNSATRPMLVVAELDNQVKPLLLEQQKSNQSPPQKVEETVPKEVFFMVKSQDDLLNDSVVLVISNYLNRVMKSKGEDMAYQTYHIVEMGDKKGVVEFVPNVLELSEVWEKNALEQIISPKEDGNRDLAKLIYIRSNHKDEDKTEDGEKYYNEDELRAIEETITTNSVERQNNFVKSFAMCCLLNYFLMLRDRHADNYLLQYTTGKLFHIDFGFIFGNTVPLKANEPDITRFSDLMRLLQKLRKTEMFYQLLDWGFDVISEEAQNVNTLVSFICYNSITENCLNKLEERLFARDKEVFLKEAKNEESLKTSDFMQRLHQEMKYLKSWTSLI
ncbi:hypothetical protein EIN_396920 [Entamoeba invadens IP1]|uniref:PI3K/PI4K catalytic domain-containing protein n=1 Tax=Entamoeba invadens IP1 TaxID=370355 RepID=A0A0A1U9X8_ENTIV|nr:hypothetical protein EIN_396920 [Entamoeba invadens IP1]ELP91842.1 hypothetical protein EIN_396920 [Entamoeba invadens IP1]|eukprot:XP_004258613.1 hypothetical protein EIN_396920 [Entamoeba invadens IP1]